MSRVLGSLMILLLVCSPAMAAHAPSCSNVVGNVIPCLDFLRDKAPGKPSKQCCGGVKKVSSMVKTKNDRVAICECIKKTLARIEYEPKRLPILGKQCGSSIDLPPIDQKTNCNKAA